MWLGNPKEFIHLGVFDSYYMQWGEDNIKRVVMQTYECTHRIESIYICIYMHTYICMYNTLLTHAHTHTHKVDTDTLFSSERKQHLSYRCRYASVVTIWMSNVSTGLCFEPLSSAGDPILGNQRLFKEAEPSCSHRHRGESLKAIVLPTSPSAVMRHQLSH